MIGIVVVTHGQLSTELLSATETMVGELPNFTAVSLGLHVETSEFSGVPSNCHLVYRDHSRSAVALLLKLKCDLVFTYLNDLPLEAMRTSDSQRMEWYQ